MSKIEYCEDLNKELLSNFSKGSHKKVWWRCNKGHEWQTEIRLINRGQGCPFCSGKRPSAENNLSLHSVSKEFHSTKNGNKTPEDFTLKSGKKIWWQCSKHPEHEWESTIANRVNGNSCPYCVSGRGWSVSKKPLPGNELSLHESSKDFHPTKNGNKTTKDFTLHSGKNVWWQCHECGWEWKCTISDRTRKDGKTIDCQKCKDWNTSKAELELIKFIESLGVTYIPRYKLDKVEADIFLPEFNIAIEFNGLYWHSDEKKDEYYHFNKWRHFYDRGIRLIQVYEDEWMYDQEIIKSLIESILFNFHSIDTSKKLYDLSLDKEDPIAFLEAGYTFDSFIPPDFKYIKGNKTFKSLEKLNRRKIFDSGKMRVVLK